MSPDIILEENQPLSKSLLWTLQKNAYTQFGPLAWSQKGVPFYVTSNPYTALQYAKMTISYLKDCFKQMDTSAPIYIFDLGAGTGRFGYLFLKSFLDLLPTYKLEHLKIRYIMTDIVEENITFLKQHPLLQPFLEADILDFSIYHHADTGNSVHLIQSGLTLSQEDFVNPLILIANYFFDTIPQDLFKIQDGKLQEGKISITLDSLPELSSLSKTSPEVIPHMHCSYSYASIKDPKHYYSDPLLANLLNTYAKQFNNITFLFPVGAFQSLNHFSELSKGRFFLLAGDQGICTEAQIAEAEEPKISLHGTFSIPVNYHALAHYFKVQHGVALLTSDPDPNYVVIAAALGNNINPLTTTQTAFQSLFNAFGPCDYWKFVNGAIQWENPPLEHILLILKLGNWDPLTFYDFFDKIRKSIPKASEELKIQLQDAIEYVWEHFYPISPDEGLFLLNLGVLLFEMGNTQAALTYFLRARELTGDQPQIIQNIAACLKKTTEPSSR